MSPELDRTVAGDPADAAGHHDAVAAAAADHKWLARAVTDLLFLLGAAPQAGAPTGEPKIAAATVAPAGALRDQIVADTQLHALICREVLLPAAWGHDLIGPAARVAAGLARLSQAAQALAERQPGEPMFAAALGLLSRELDSHEQDCGPVLARIRGLGTGRRAELWDRAQNLAQTRRGSCARSPHWH